MSAPLNRNSHEALYVQLAQELVGHIKAGRFKAEDRLPTEQELMRQYGVSRVTVRQAMDLVVTSGLVIRRRAKGAFVVGTHVKQDLAQLTGFYDALIAQGVAPETQLLDFRPVTTPAAVRAKLGYGEAVLLLRKYLVQSQGLAIAYTHLHPSARNVTFDQAAANPSYRILEHIVGFKIAQAHLEIRAGYVGDGPARNLGQPASAPVLVMERTTFSPQDEPLEHTLFYLRSDAYEFGLTVRGAFSIANGIRAATT